MDSRTALVKRQTGETDLQVEINLDDFNAPLIETGVGFFDHMLEQLGKHSGIALRVEGSGDLEVDSHHLVEDVGITLGDALNKALAEKRGIKRYSSIALPFDETLVRASIDISGRGYLGYGIETTGNVEGFPMEVLPEFFRGMTNRGEFTLHLDQLKGKNKHHLAEATFKAFARVLRNSVAVVGSEIPSTKGTLTE